MTTPDSGREEQVTELVAAQDRYYGQDYKWSGDPASSNWVTNLAHPCGYYSLAARLFPSPRPEERVLAMFEQGHEAEATTKARLTLRLGCSWKLSELRLRWDAYDITGRLDGVVTLPSGGSYICELKALSALAWPRVHKMDDLFGLPYWRHRTYPLQVQLYMWMAPDSVKNYRENVSLDKAVLGLVDKGSTFLKPLWIYREGYEDEVEAVIKRAEAVNHALKGGPEPEKLGRPSVCMSCDYQAECGPNLTFAAPLLAENPEFLQALEERSESEPAADSFKAADKFVKGQMREADWGESDTLIAGRWTIMRKVNRAGAVSFDFGATTKPEEEEVA